MRARDYQHLEGPDRPPRHDGDERIVRKDDALVTLQFLLGVRAQQAFVACGPIGAQAQRFFEELVGDVELRPNLSVRVRVARAHHRTAVFENRYGVDVRNAGELRVLIGPAIDDAGDGLLRQRGQMQIVARRVTDDPAVAGLGFSGKQQLSLGVTRREVLWRRSERWKIVAKNKRRLVFGIALAVGANVAGTQVALRIVLGYGRCGNGRVLSLPRPVGAMRRYEYPLV